MQKSTGFCDPTRFISTARSFPLTGINVIAATQAVDISNERRRREHMQVDPDFARQLEASTDWRRRMHVELATVVGGNTVRGLFTIEQLTRMSAIDTVAISSSDGLAKLVGASLPLTANLTIFEPSSGISDATAQATGAYYETLVDNGSNTGFCVIAPHGGQIELYTDTMADELETSFNTGTLNPITKWIGRGYNILVGQTGYQRWHITSVDIYEGQYPLLDSIYERDFEFVVSLHGQSGTLRIDIGGNTAETTFIDSLVTTLRAAGALSGVSIVRTESDAIEGQSVNNIGNRLVPTSDQYVQFEMTLDVRNSPTRRAAIIAALKTAYEAR